MPRNHNNTYTFQCGCQSVAAHDRSSPPVNGTIDEYDFVETRHVCDQHGGLFGLQVWSTCFEESTRASKFKQKLLQEHPELGQIFTTESGEQQYFDIKGGITLVWAWSGVNDARTLQVQILGANLTTPQKNNLQSKVDAFFGAGKVVII